MSRLEEINLVPQIWQPRPKGELHGALRERRHTRQRSGRKTAAGCSQDVPAIEPTELKTDLVVHGILLRFVLAALNSSGIPSF
jgi:hypothetical protein